MKKQEKLNVYYYNVGSCNGCDIELVSGVILNESKNKINIANKPEKADVVVFTGILTKKIKPYFLKVLKKLPKKALKIAFGSCGVSGNVFQDTYTFDGPIDKYTKIDLYVNGCPPKGDEYLDGILEKIGLFKPKKDKVGKYWRGELKFYPKKCIGCLTCVYHCPARTIGVESTKKGFELVYDYEKCFFCAMCERKCPTGAIVLTHKTKMIEKDRKKFVTRGPITKGHFKAKIDSTKI